MSWIARTTAVLTTIAVVFHCSLPALAATEATIEGKVEIPCDPSRVSEVALVQILPVSAGPPVTVTVDPSSGTFRSSGLTEGEYELFAIGADGQRLSPETQRLLLREGLNQVVLSMQPPGCGEQDTDGDGVSDEADQCPNSPPGTAVGTDGCPAPGETRPGPAKKLEGWQLTLIYFGVVAGAVVVLDIDDEEPASPVSP